MFALYSIGSRVKTALFERRLTASDAEMTRKLQELDHKLTHDGFSIITCNDRVDPNCPSFDSNMALTRSEQTVVDGFRQLGNNDNLVTELAEQTRILNYMKKIKQVPGHLIQNDLQFIQQYVADNAKNGTVIVQNAPTNFVKDEIRIRVDVANILSAIKVQYDYENFVDLPTDQSSQLIFNRLSDAIDSLFLK